MDVKPPTMKDSKLKPCCVPGCFSWKERRFHMPCKCEERELWLRRIGDERLFTERFFMRRVNQLMVCERHFDKMCFGADGNLLLHALPTLHLPSFAGTSTLETCFLYQQREEKCEKTLSLFSDGLEDEEELWSVNIPKKTYLSSENPQKKLEKIEENYIENEHHYAKSACDITPVDSFSDLTNIETTEIDLKEEELHNIIDLEMNAFEDEKLDPEQFLEVLREDFLPANKNPSTSATSMDFSGEDHDYCNDLCILDTLTPENSSIMVGNEEEIISAPSFTSPDNTQKTQAIYTDTSNVEESLPADSLPSTEGVIKAVLVVKNGKLMSLLPLDKPVKLPHNNSLTDRRNCILDAETKTSIKKLVKEVTANNKAKAATPLSSDSLDHENILDIIDGKENSYNEHSLLLQGMGKVLRRLLVPLKTPNVPKIPPLKNKANRKRKPGEESKQAKQMKKPKKLYHPVCRVCMNVIFDDYFSGSEVSSKGYAIKDMLTACVPEIDYESVTSSVLCSSCVFDLSISYEFKNKCLKSEEAISEYKRAKLIPSGSAVRMKHVFKYHSSSLQKNQTQEGEGTEDASTNETEGQLAKPKKVLTIDGVIIQDNQEDPVESLIDDEAPPERQETREEDLIRLEFDISKVLFSDGSERRNKRRQKDAAILECAYCEKTFVLEQRLKLHLFKKHNIATMYRCKLCGKSYKESHVLRQHISHLHAILPVSRVNKFDNY